MSKIQTIKDKDENIVYPQTVVQAIYDESGKTLNTVLTDFVKADEANPVENVNDTPELVANKVTSIDNTSTDTQYPSAKAVYNTILANKSVGIKISVVNELPTENIDDKTMYLKSNGTSETQNIYDEYLYVNNNWEHIGSTATTVDLSEYLKEADADKKYIKKMSGNEMDAICTLPYGEREKYIDMLVVCGTFGSSTYKPGHIYQGIDIEQEHFFWNDITEKYTLPTASAETLGGIKIGNGLSVDDSGVVSVNSSGIQNAENTNIQITKVWVGTQTQYDAITTKDNNTEYNIIEE